MLHQPANLEIQPLGSKNDKNRKGSGLGDGIILTKNTRWLIILRWGPQPPTH